MLEYLVTSSFIPKSYSLRDSFRGYPIAYFTHALRKEIKYTYNGNLRLDNRQVIKPVSAIVVGFDECHVLTDRGEDYKVGWKDRVSGLSFREALGIHLKNIEN